MSFWKPLVTANLCLMRCPYTQKPCEATGMLDNGQRTVRMNIT